MPHSAVRVFVTLPVNGLCEDNPVPCRWGGSLYFPVCNDTRRLWWPQCGSQSFATLASFVLVKTNLVQAAVGGSLCVGVCEDTSMAVHSRIAPVVLFPCVFVLCLTRLLCTCSFVRTLRSHGHFGSGEESAASELHSIRNCAVPSLHAMAMLEPTAAEIVSMKSLSDVTQWLQVPPQIAEDWFEKLGATRKDSTSIVGMLTHEEVDTEVMTIHIDDKPLSLMQKGLLRAALHVCRLVSGMAQSGATPVPSVLEPEPHSNMPVSEPAVAPLIVGPQVALKQVISQGSEETVPKLSAKDLHLHWDRFKEVDGRDPRP